MRCILIFVLISPLTSSVIGQEVSKLESFSEEVTRIDSFNLFSVINGIVGGISNFAHLISSLNDIFSVVYNEPGVKNTSIPIPEDTYLNISRLAVKYGYRFENHTVTTEDGYTLTLHRIPHGRNGTTNGLVAFLMHGIMDSSDSWVIQGPDKALAYILADQGFDVWMGNARGNKHALTHVKFNPKQSEFWKFTWDEIGVYDLPAMIDYALNVTKKDGLFYVGHSQGTTSFYVLNSLKPEYIEKVKMMFSLAPVAWMRHVKSPIVRMFSPAYKILGYLLSNFNTYTPTTDFFNKIASVICTVTPTKCDNLLYLMLGNDDKFLNKTMIPVIFGHMPSGSSTLQFVHYGQLVQSGRFCRYDFGEEKNFKLYGQITPTEYNLRNINTPITLFYGGNDWLSDPSDVDLLKTQLNVFDDYFIEEYNHLDFLYATNANDLIYSRIVKDIYDFENTIFS